MSEPWERQECGNEWEASGARAAARYWMFVDAAYRVGMDCHLEKQYLAAADAVLSGYPEWAHGC